MAGVVPVAVVVVALVLFAARTVVGIPVSMRVSAAALGAIVGTVLGLVLGIVEAVALLPFVAELVAAPVMGALKPLAKVGETILLVLAAMMSARPVVHPLVLLDQALVEIAVLIGIKVPLVELVMGPAKILMDIVMLFREVPVRPLMVLVAVTMSAAVLRVGRRRDRDRDRGEERGGRRHQADDLAHSGIPKTTLA